MSKSISRKERLRAKNQADGNKIKGNNFRVLDTKDYPDIPWLKPELEVEYVLDLVPYTVTSKLHPEYAELKSQDFLEDYKLDLYVHKGVGPSNKSLVCPNKNYGKPCPICEEHDRLLDEKEVEWGDEKEYQLRPKQRSFFVVVDNEDGNKMKFFEYSYAWFTKNLITQAKRKSKRKEILLGDVSEDGYSIAFAFEENTFGGKKTPGEVKAFDFIELDNKYTDEDIENTPKLDTMVILKSYDEIYDIFWANEDVDEDDDDDEEEQPKTSRRKVVEEDGDDDDGVLHKRRRASKDDDEDEPTPSRRRKVEEEETPVRSRRERKKSETPECPVDENGFGEMIDQFSDCDDCPLYDACDKKFEETHNE